MSPVAIAAILEREKILSRWMGRPNCVVYADRDQIEGLERRGRGGGEKGLNCSRCNNRHTKAELGAGASHEKMGREEKGGRKKKRPTAPPARVSLAVAAMRPVCGDDIVVRGGEKGEKEKEKCPHASPICPVKSPMHRSASDW